MDDNQNEWGDEDLETKKFRVSWGRLPRGPPAPFPARCDVAPGPLP